jgi:hypothetical protein
MHHLRYAFDTNIRNAVDIQAVDLASERCDLFEQSNARIRFLMIFRWTCSGTIHFGIALPYYPINIQCHRKALSLLTSIGYFC